MIFALTGTPLVLGKARGLIGLAIMIVSFYEKAHKEDQKHFPGLLNHQDRREGLGGPTARLP
jgi:hypothetical protein